MKPFLLALIVALPAGLVLVGCGQKGPLYLPGHNPNPPKPLIRPPSQKPKKSSDRPTNPMSAQSSSGAP